MNALIQSLIDGVLIGGVYGVISVGLSLVFGVLRIVNFAQAEFLMLGMYSAWFASRYLGLDPVFGASSRWRSGSYSALYATGYSSAASSTRRQWRRFS